MGLLEDMKNQLDSKSLLTLSKDYAFQYIDYGKQSYGFPSNEDINNLDYFTETMPEKTGNPVEIIKCLSTYGSPATISPLNGRYYGFVTGGSLPITTAVKWLTDIWDQNAALYLTSPLSSKLEDICEKWLVELFNLPRETAVGFVSGTTMASFCALAAARNEILKRNGWDYYKSGLYGAPKLRIITSRQIHASIIKTLSLLGFGEAQIEYVDVDSTGKIIINRIPQLDPMCIVIIQAGNVNTGAFDPLSDICDMANDVNAWVHIDGAFGLWANCSKKTKPLLKGIEKASSWSVDAHKTLNVPYDNGIVACKNRDSLISAMQTNGKYLQFSHERDGMIYTNDMSRRARIVELWAAMKYLGKEGIEALINQMCELAVYCSELLKKEQFIVLNKVEFNQVLFCASDEVVTDILLKRIQNSKVFWCGGTKWNNKTAIRLSICSWLTTVDDIRITVQEISSIKRALLESEI